MPTKAVEQAADEIYGLPLADFTKRRDELAKKLRTDGKRADADAVKALRKPTAAAWAMNQLARRRSKDVKRLLATGKRLRAAHEALYSGGDRTRLQKVSGEERDLVDKLARDASAVAGEAGTAATANLDEQIRNTLHAAALDEETATELQAGRLLREREAIGMFGTGTEVPQKPKPPPRTKRSAAERAKEDAAQQRNFERALKAAQSDEQKARRAHATAAKAAERAAKAAETAQRRADEARTALREAERTEREAANAHEKAATAVTKAERRLAT